MRKGFQFLLILICTTIVRCQECNVVGECLDGATVGVALTSTNDLCLEYCQHNTGCELYTFYADKGTCIMYEECYQFIREPCEDYCVSGQVCTFHCHSNTEPFAKLFSF